MHRGFIMFKRHLGFMVILVALLVVPLTGCGLLGETGAVTGTVTDGETGEPLEGVQVSIGTRTDDTDEEGNYTLTEVGAGTQTIKAQAEDPIDEIYFATYRTEINVKGKETVTHDIEMERLDSKTEIAQEMLQEIRNYFHNYVEKGEEIFDEDYFKAFGTEIEEVFSQYLVFALIHVVESLVIEIPVFEAIEGNEPGIIDVELDWEDILFGGMVVGETQEHEEDFWIINVDDFIVFKFNIDIAEDPDPDDPLFLGIEILSITMEDEIPQELENKLPEFDPEKTNYSGEIELSSTLTWGEFEEILESDAPPEELSALLEFEFIQMTGTDDLLDGDVDFSGLLEIDIIEFSFIGFEDSGKPEKVTIEIDVKLDGQFDGPGLEINGAAELSISAHLQFGEEHEEPEAVDLTVSISSATDIRLGTDLLAFDGDLEKLHFSGGMERKENNENNGEEIPFINEIQLIAQGGLYHNLVQVNETKIGIQNFDPEDWDIAIEGDIDINMQPKTEGAIYFSASGYLHLPDVKPFEGNFSAKLSFEEATEWILDTKPEKLEIEMEAHLGETDTLAGEVSITFNDWNIINIQIENQAGYYLVMAFKAPQHNQEDPEMVDDEDSGIFCPAGDKLAEIYWKDNTFKVFWLTEEKEETLF